MPSYGPGEGGGGARAAEQSTGRMSLPDFLMQQKSGLRQKFAEQAANAEINIFGLSVKPLETLGRNLAPSLTPEESIEQKKAYKELLKNKEVTSETRGTYAAVLTRELMAIRDLKEKGTLPTEEWQKRLLTVVDPSGNLFQEIHGSTDLSKNVDDQFDAFQTVFTRLLEQGENGSPEEAREWMVTAVEATKRQIIALQAVTQARINSPQEADKLDYVDELTAMSGIFASEGGKPIDEIRAELIKLKKEKLGDPAKWNLFGKFIKSWKAQIIEDHTMRQDDKSIRAMWKRFETEMSKRPFNTTEVDFPNGHVVDYNRTVNGQPLDAVQKKVIEGLTFVGTRDNIGELGVKGQTETGDLLKSMAHAQQEAYFALFDIQLTRASQLNLITPTNIPGNFATNFSGQYEIRTGIEGVPALPVNVDNIGGLSLDQRLNAVTINIGKRIEERKETLNRSEVRTNVAARVAELKKRKNGRELTPQEQANKASLEQRAKDADEIERLETETGRDAREIAQQTSELAPAITARTEKKTEEDKKAKADNAVLKLTAEQTRKTAEIGALENRIVELTKQLSGAKGGTAPALITSIETQISTLEGKITSLKEEVYDNATNPNNLEKKIADEIENSKKAEKEITNRQQILELYQQQLTQYDELVKKHKSNETRLASLRTRYSGQTLNKHAIERELLKFGGISPAEQHELDVLTTFETEIINAEKWSEIQRRRNADFDLSVAITSRPQVQPAYLKTLSIIAGKGILEDTPVGQKTYDTFSQFVSPELFLSVYISNPQRLAALQTAYNTVHGVLPSMDDLQIYNEALQDPAIRASMLQNINKEFVNDLLGRMVHDASIKTSEGQILLGARNETDQDILDEIASKELPENALERVRNNLEANIEREKAKYIRSSEMHLEQASEQILTVLAAEGVSPTQATNAIEAVQNALKNAGIDRDVTNVDLTAGPLAPILTQAFTDAGLTALTPTNQEHLINTIRKSGLSAEDIAPYARAEQAVVSVGLTREQTPYVVAAIKRAALKAGFSGEVTDIQLENPPGTVTPEGAQIQSELFNINVGTLTIDQKLTLLNNLPQEFLPEVYINNIRQKLDGSKAASTIAIIHNHGVVGYRTIMSSVIDRSRPFTVTDVTPAIRTTIAAEYRKIGLDIDDPTDLWSNDDVARVIDAARPEGEVLRSNLDANQNKAIQEAVTTFGFNAGQSYDVARGVQKFLMQFNLRGNISETQLELVVNGKKLHEHLQDIITETLGPGAPLPTTWDVKQMAGLVSATPGIQEGIASPSTIQKTQEINKIMKNFLKYDGSYHEAAVLGVLMSEADMDTIRILARAAEQVKKGETTSGRILSLISDPPRTHLRRKMANILMDGTNGFLDIYNAANPPGTMILSEVPVNEVRRIAGMVLTSRLGGAGFPAQEYINAKSISYQDTMNAQFDRIQFERAAQKLDTTFWGVNGTELTYKIQEKLGGSTYRDQALLYTAAILERRAKFRSSQDKTNEETTETS